MPRRKKPLPEVVTHHAKTGATIYEVSSQMDRGTIIHKFAARLEFAYLGVYVPAKHGHNLLPRVQRKGLKAFYEKAREAAYRQFVRHPWSGLLRRHAVCDLGPCSYCTSDRHQLHFPTGIADLAFGIHGEATRLVFHDYPNGQTMIEAYIRTRTRGPLVLVYLDSRKIRHPWLQGVYADLEINGHLLGRVQVIEEEAEASGYHLHGHLIDTIVEIYQQRRKPKRRRCRPAAGHPERCIARDHGEQPDLSQYEEVLRPVY